MKKITIVYFQDDNFGDVLIKVCFQRLLEVALENLGYNSSEVEIVSTNVKHENLNIILSSDIVVFSGGGLFGSSYLGFLSHMLNIVKCADTNNIPVLFFSMGINDMDCDETSIRLLRELFSFECIKGLSVRENEAWFKKFVSNKTVVSNTCDPAVWTKYVFSKDIPNNKSENKTIIGINVVRGELFKDNLRKWTLEDEIQYLLKLKLLCKENDYDVRFYTNGSTFDNNVLMTLLIENGVPECEVLFVDSSRELVKTISSFDGVAAIRMHSSIVSYSLNIPSVNLLWNDKIPYFYSQINREENCIALSDKSAEMVYESLNKQIRESKTTFDKNFAMSLYNNIVERIAEVINVDPDYKYSFEEVIEKLQKKEVPLSQDISDMKLKILMGEKRYYYRCEDIKKLRKKENE